MDNAENSMDNLMGKYWGEIQLLKGGTSMDNGGNLIDNGGKIQWLMRKLQWIILENSMYNGGKFSD